MSSKSEPNVLRLLTLNVTLERNYNLKLRDSSFLSTKNSSFVINIQVIKCVALRALRQSFCLHIHSFLILELRLNVSIYIFFFGEEPENVF